MPTKGTYFYSPDVKVYIKCDALDNSDNTIDVSQDVVEFSINRAVNATSTAQITLANPHYKYTPIRRKNKKWDDGKVPISTMDKIVIYLKKESYLQVFSGYVTVAPVLTIIPESITIEASCSLYTIQNTYWDPYVPQMQNLVPGMLMQDSHGGAASYADGGVAQGIVNVLTTVANWKRDNIHIAALPGDWVTSITDYYDSATATGGYLDDKNSRELFVRALDGGGIVAGNNLIVGPDGSQSTQWGGDFALGYGDNARTITKSGNPTLWPLMQTATTIPRGADLVASVAPEGIGYSSVTSAGGVPGVVATDVKVKQIARFYAAKHKMNTGQLSQDQYNKLLTGEDQSVVDDAYINSLNPVDLDVMHKQFWCVLPWQYLTSSVKNDASLWLSIDGDGGYSGRHIVITSVTNAQQIVVKVSMFGETGGKIILSKQAWEALAGAPVTTNIQSVGNGSSTGNFYSQTNIRVTASWAKPGKTKAGIQDSTKLVDTLNTYGVKLGHTAAQTDSQLGYQNLSLEAEDWCKLALQMANLPFEGKNGSFNVGFMMAWIGKEYKNRDHEWDSRCNPLNMKLWANNRLTKLSNGTYKEVAGSAQDGSGSYPNLYIAAAVFAMAINPAVGWATGGQNLVTAVGGSLKTIGGQLTAVVPFPEILAALSDRQEHIKKPNGINYDMGLHNWTKAYYWSPHWGLAPKTYKKDSRIYADFDNILGLGKAVSYDGKPWGAGINISGMSDSDKWEIFAQALITSNWAANHYQGTKGHTVSASDLFDGVQQPKGKSQEQGELSVNTPNPTLRKWVEYYVSKRHAELFPDNYMAPANPSTSSGTSTPSFNIAFTPPQLDPTALVLYGTPRGFVTDQPLLGAITSMAAATLRDFQSAPNGDFICWFPDYFGLYGQAPTLVINPVEIINFAIYHNDHPVTTHVAVAGDPFSLGGGVGLPQWMSSNGIVSVQMEELIKNMFTSTSNKLNWNDEVKQIFNDNAKEFLQRYGMRPRIEAVPMIRNHVTEFMYAWRLFMTGWAEQYSTQVQFTFMPELYPGMRVKINMPDNSPVPDIEVYVQSVSHSGSRATGFSTSAQVTCPITRDSDGNAILLHYGYPLKG